MPQVLWTEDNIASLYETVGTVGLGVAASLSGGPENSGAGGIPETLREDVLGDSDRPTILYHYTTQEGYESIVKSNELRASTQKANPKDVRYGNGQYMSDILPGTKTSAQLSRIFLGNPFQGKRYTHYIAIDVTGLNIIKGRDGVFVIPNDCSLDLTGRIIGGGKVP